MNWFKEVFLNSFDICNGKRVSEKQAGIFRKYFDIIDCKIEEWEQFNAYYEKYKFDNLIYIIQESIVGYGKNKWKEYYLTIKEVQDLFNE